MAHVEKSTCRACSAFCPVNVTIDDGRVLKVEGNPDAPLYEGFICPKGRALAAAHNNPDRLKHHLKRMPDGSHQPISSEQLVTEISERIRAIVDRHGPKSVATYMGNVVIEQQACVSMMLSFLTALGSDHFYTTSTIDQAAIPIADTLHGKWAGGRTRPERWGVCMIVGGNPIISKQYFSQDPGRQLKRLVKNGTKLIVIDPRRTETARKAHLHLQCIPGEDPTIVAGLIHLIISEGAVNRSFTDANASGLEQLSAAVKDFTPAYVAERAGIAEADLREAARMLAAARTGNFASGLGPTMATRGTLTVYLLRCLQTLRGFWAGEGEPTLLARVTMPRVKWKAQPNPPGPAWGFGRTTRVRGLQMTVAGMPLGSLPEEILTPGEGQVRALFLHGAPLQTWPQHDLVRQALGSLDLLVIHDIETTLSPTAQMADYVIATKLQFEVPVITQLLDMVTEAHPGYGWSEPYGMYQSALLTPPPDADVLDAWQIYYRIAQKLGMPLKLCGFGGGDPAQLPDLDMAREPTTEALYELMCRDSVIPLSEMKKYPDGKIYDKARETVGPRDADCTARLELADPHMMEELKTVRTESIAKRRGTDSQFPYLLIPRRIQNTTNSAWWPKNLLKTPYNPAYMHASELLRLGVLAGDMVEIRSRHGAIVGFVDIDNDLRPGVLSMCHGFGKHPAGDYQPRRDGSNVQHLLHWEDDYDPYCGMPRMSAVPIAVVPIEKKTMAA